MIVSCFPRASRLFQSVGIGLLVERGSVNDGGAPARTTDGGFVDPT